MAHPVAVLARLAADLQEEFDDGLLSWLPHDSWALGDFTPGRSDLDVLVVLATDTTPAMLAALREVHARLATDFPAWPTGTSRSSTCRSTPWGPWAGDECTA